MKPPGSKALRKGRKSRPGRIYYLTKNLLEKDSSILTEKGHPELAMKRFFWAMEKNWWSILAFVVMPDHYHLVIRLGEVRTLEEILQQVNRLISREVNTLRGTRGTLWQDGAHDRCIRPHEDIHDYINYVHMNPVEAGLVDFPEQWPWSSAHEKYRGLVQGD